jgi:glycosyltransferase involved in cell wall biosynthesis
MPRISVIVPTTRVGGLDITLGSLSRQSFKDFEVVIVDALYYIRGPQIQDNLNKYRNWGMNIKYVPPIHNPFPIHSFCIFVNTALVEAHGDIAIVMSDYGWCPPGLLEIHAKFHEGKDRVGLMCPHMYMTTPELHSDFKTYTKPEIDKYCGDIVSGRLNQVMWSIFKSPMDPVVRLEDLGLVQDPLMSDCDIKLRLQAGPVTTGFYHAKNESCKLEYFLAINGFDEDLDGANCFQDSDIAERLTVKAGVNWTVDPSNRIYYINPRHIFPYQIRHRGELDNEAIYVKKRAIGFPTPNKWNLLERRCYKI